MTSEEITEFLARPLHAIVAVNRPGRGPQLTPVWFVWDGATFRFSTTSDRAKYPNIQRDPQISLIVDDPTGHTYVSATGRAEIAEENIPELTRPILEKYTPGNVEQGLAAMAGGNRVIVILHPDKLVTS